MTMRGIEGPEPNTVNNAKRTKTTHIRISWPIRDMLVMEAKRSKISISKILEEVLPHIEERAREREAIRDYKKRFDVA